MEPLESRIRQVTVYRRGAVVTREIPCPADGWPDEVIVDRLPLALDDGSVRVRFADFARGGPEATDVRVELWVPPLGEPVEPPSEAEIRRSEESIEALAAELERLDEEQGYLEALELKLPPRLERKPPQPVSAQAWAGALGWMETQAEQRDAKRSELNAAIQEAEEQLQRLQRQAAAARAERGVDEEALCKQVKVALRAAGDARPSAMEIEYRVPGACWRPSYVLRVTPDGSEASLAVRALLCQRSGEPWERVQLALSTADLRREVALPELASIRIGRRQPPEPSLAWREPPSGADSLFEDLDSAMADRPGAPPPPPPPVPRAPRGGRRRSKTGALKKKAKRHEARAEMEEELVFAEAPEEACEPDMMMDDIMDAAPPPAQSRPAPQAAPMPAAEFQAVAKSASLMSGLAGAAANAFGAAPARGGFEQAAVEEPGPARLTVRQDLFDYAQLRLGPWDAGSGRRGKLTHLSLQDTLGDLTRHQARQVEHHLRQAQRQALDLRDFPNRSRDVAQTSGAYDYIYAADGPVDVPADGAVHNVPLTAREAPVQLTLVVVPRESDQAVRVATLRNPLHSPLLEGEADIYLGGEFLITSRVATVPAGADLDVGLGVEEALKVARNTHFKEETEGLLGGSLALAHTVDIEVASRLARPVQVEIRERVPVRDEDDDDEVKIKVGSVSPPWSDWDQTPENRLRGGKRWRFELPAGGEQELHYEYAVHIDSKNEIVGGNRRERG
jgi:hypothetical protein